MLSPGEAEPVGNGKRLADIISLDGPDREQGKLKIGGVALADVQPFAGLRYNLARFDDAQTMAQLIAPPYDVIDPDKRLALVTANPYNVVRLELPEGEDRYNAAAQLLHEWVAASVLAQDSQPAFYVYDEEFSLPDGSTVANRAIFAAVRLYDWSDNVVMAHESTMTGPKADRLALLQATRVNLSPIFSVYDDADGAVRQAVNRGYAQYWQSSSSVNEGSETRRTSPVQPGVDFVDTAGNHGRLTPITDPETVAAISAAFAGKRLYIADGHHRYETALNYRNEQRAQTGGEDETANFVMMALTAVDDPGLRILPTHRVITELSAEARHRLQAHLEKHFEIVHFPQGDQPGQTISRRLAEYKAERKDKQHLFGVYGLEEGYVSLVSLTDASVLAGGDDHSAAWRELDVAILQKVILQDGIGMSEQTLAAGSGIVYTKDEAEAIEMVGTGAAQIAFFLRPTPITAVLAIADAHDRMPRKSTYFMPKLPTGVVMRSLGPVKNYD